MVGGMAVKVGVALALGVTGAEVAVGLGVTAVGLTGTLVAVGAGWLVDMTLMATSLLKPLTGTVTVPLTAATTPPSVILPV